MCSSFDRYKEGLEKKQQSDYQTEQFFQDLQLIFEQKQLFSQTEWIDYTLLYAKVAYELKRFAYALAILQEHLFIRGEEEVKTTHLADAHFLAALCHSQLHPDYSAFCMHSEKALELNPKLYDAHTTHIQLYNAYISLAGFGRAENELSGSQSQRETCLEQAGEHLYEVFSRAALSLKEENLFWLASYYHSKAKAHFDQLFAYKVPPPADVLIAVERSSKLYETLFFNEDGRLIGLTEKTAHLETECLKWAKCLEYEGKNQEKLALLKALIDQQSATKSISWQAKQEVLVEYGLTCLALGKTRQALQTFSFIDRSSPALIATSLKNLATLKAARLEFSLLPEPLKKACEPQVSQILVRLKDLQILKSSVDFPNHIEAALDYAHIRAALVPEKEKNSCYRHFLKRIEEDFSSENPDAITKEYLREIEQTEEKAQALAAYFTFFRAEHLRLNAEMSRSEEKMSEMEELHEKALALYSEVKTSLHTPEPLFKRTCESIRLINATTGYD